MINNKSYLKNLIGQSIKNIDVDINTVVSLKEKKDDRPDQLMSVCTQIYFDKYRLDIYSKTKIIGAINITIKDLEGSKVIETNETNEIAELFFDNGNKLIIDLRDEGYSSDPEAMCLQGPDNLIVVWD